MASPARIFVLFALTIGCGFSGLAKPSCGKPDSIAVSIAASVDDDQMPLIVLSTKNISDHVLTCEAMAGTEGWAFPKIHIEGDEGTPSKTIWYRRRSLEYRFPELMVTLNVGCEASFGKAQYPPGDTLSIKLPLVAYYFIEKPGDYSAYLEVHDPEETCDPNAKWLRTNTVPLHITPKQAEKWEARAGVPRVHATISKPQPVILPGHAPVIHVEFQTDGHETYDGDDFFPHVRQDSVEPPRTTYYRERLHEPGTPQYELFQGPQPPFPGMERKSFSIDAKSAEWDIDLRNFYSFEKPGKYSVYLEFPDFSGKLLRSNSIDFAIAPSD